MKNQKGFSLIEGLLIVIALSIVGFVGFYVYNANKEEPKISDSSIYQKQQDEGAQEQLPAIDKEVAEADSLPELVDYGEEGVVIKKPGDVSKLENATESFKSFIADEISEIHKKDKCIFIQVSRIYKDEFASGAEGSNGGGECYGYGARAFWMKTDESWSRNNKLGGHEVPLCSYVNSVNAPRQIVKECQDDSKSVKDYNYPIIKNTN